MSDKQLSSLLGDLSPEIILGIAAPVGAEISRLQTDLSSLLGEFGYEVVPIRLSQLLQDLKIETRLIKAPEVARINSFMDAGDEVRKTTKRNDILALLAVAEIAKKRSSLAGKKLAFFLNSLKHPDEVHLLRQCYGSAFFLIGGYASREHRIEHLVKDFGAREDQAANLVGRDEEEPFDYGQRLDETFHRADVFVPLSGGRAPRELERFVDLLFGHPWTTPTMDEQGMFLAYSAATRSAQPGRQVGASILSAGGDVIAVGANDVPRFGGGLYWPGDDDFRDHIKRFDSNDRELQKLADRIVERLEEKNLTDQALRDDVSSVVRGGGLAEITEFGRAVHAEMEGLLACARTSRSPAGGTLFSTTFPCHNCAKHIVASGLVRVIFIEPYRKSKAPELHEDAIALSQEDVCGKVQFSHFFGVGPRRFIDLFSVNLSDAYPIQRKAAGKLAEWTRKGASLRVPLLRSDSRIHSTIEKLLTREIGALMPMNDRNAEQKGANHGDNA